MSAVARDAANKNSLVVLKRWECSDQPLAQRAVDVTYYDRATQPLARLQHPMIPRVLDRFAEGRHYYMAMQYIDGESLAEHLQRTLRPLPEAEGIGYMYALLNVLMELEKHQIRHYALFPEHILLERTRKRALLSGFHIAPAPGILTPRTHGSKNKTTRKLAISPYLPVQDRPYDQRTCIYALTASFHHALTNVAPPHFPTYPPMRMLNPAISAECEAVFSRALAEDPTVRYQNYASLKRDLQKLLARP
jgi:serine/threonine protein kinase